MHSKSVSRPPREWLSTTAEPFSFHFIPSHTSANELSCGALSPYGCELTLKKLEPHADVDSVRSLVASPPTIETFISSGWSPGNQHSPGRPTVATISGRMRRRTLSFASTFAKT